MSGFPWSAGKIETVLKRGTHKSPKNSIDFLRNEFADMMEKQQWIFLSADMIKRMYGLRLSLTKLVEQKSHSHRMISD